MDFGTPAMISSSATSINSAERHLALFACTQMGMYGPVVGAAEVECSGLVPPGDRGGAGRGLSVAQTNSDVSEVDALRTEVGQLRAELAAFREEHRGRGSRRWRRGRVRSVLTVGLLLAFASVGGVGYASVANVAAIVPGTQPSGSYQGLTPVRILDTRHGTGAPQAAVAAFGTVSLAVAGVDGVPADAIATVLNVTVTEPTRAGNISVYPDGASVPNASNLNFLPGQSVPNLVVATIGGDGKVDFLNRSSGTVQLIADVAGYYAPGQTNTLVVPSDGSASQNGAALVAVLGSLSGSTPTLVQLEAGSYDLTAQLNVPANTGIVGAGTSLTTITSNASAAKAIDFYGATGVNSASGFTLVTNANEAIDMNTVSVALDNLRINFAGAASGDPAIAVEAPTTIDNTIINGSGPFEVGVTLEGGSLVMQNSTIVVSETGFANTSSATATIRDSLLAGATVSMSVLSGTTDVATSQVIGPVAGAGTFICVDDYNASYAPLGPTCT